MIFKFTELLLYKIFKWNYSSSTALLPDFNNCCVECGKLVDTHPKVEKINLHFDILLDEETNTKSNDIVNTANNATSDRITINSLACGECLQKQQDQFNQY
ncbi:hypothetical protein RCL_jg13987.t1 [Rhizophagus clarus]|uniref:Uncharacterized protein n=1 Tax=Rhizophagus clarus TaxID=94130 RepID=A0A8H3LRH1_9GLOM|nr:hypothetical protein RCL_jg13987.t1 [Rhizophagus clarus]